MDSKSNRQAYCDMSKGKEGPPIFKSCHEIYMYHADMDGEAVSGELCLHCEDADVTRIIF